MGRSVGVLTDAIATVYAGVQQDDPPAYYNSFTDTLQEALLEAFPSMMAPPLRRGWIDREGILLLENAHARVVVYEYLDIWSVSLGVEPHAERPGLAESWCRKNAERFVSVVRTAITDVGGTPLERLGGFSDGTSVYREVTA